MHDFIGLLNVVLLAQGLDPIDIHIIGIFPTEVLTFLIIELLRVLKHMRPLALAQASIRKQAQDAGSEPRILMIQFPKLL